MNESPVTSTAALLPQPKFQYSGFVPQEKQGDKPVSPDNAQFLIIGAKIHTDENGKKSATFITAPNTYWGHFVQFVLSNSSKNRKKLKEAFEIHVGNELLESNTIHNFVTSSSDNNNRLTVAHYVKLAHGKDTLLPILNNLSKNLKNATAANNEFQETARNFIKQQQDPKNSSQTKKELCEELIKKYAEAWSSWQTMLTTYLAYKTTLTPHLSIHQKDIKKYRVTEYKASKSNIELLLNATRTAVEAFNIEDAKRSPDEPSDTKYIKHIQTLFDYTAHTASHCMMISPSTDPSRSDIARKLEKITKLKNDWYYNEDFSNEDSKASSEENPQTSTQMNQPVTALPANPDDIKEHLSTKAEWRVVPIHEAQVDTDNPDSNEGALQVDADEEIDISPITAEIQPETPTTIEGSGETAATPSATDTPTESLKTIRNRNTPVPFPIGG